MLIALLLAAAVDAGSVDAGASIQPVVLDIAHGELWLTSLDGGSEDSPTLVTGGTYMDTPTTEWVAANKARAHAESATLLSDSGGAFSTSIGWLIGGAGGSLLVGLIAGLAVGWFLFH